jgi:hypothetical protein
MYFFADTSKPAITGTVPIGTWNVAGYQQINVHAWVRGGSGTVSMWLYFDQLLAATETFTIGPVAPGAQGVAIVTRTCPVYAPQLHVVFGNPLTTPTDFRLRLYAACCEPPQRSLLTRLFRIRPAEDGEPQRKLSTDVDIDALIPGPDESAPGA